MYSPTFHLNKLCQLKQYLLLKTCITIRSDNIKGCDAFPFVCMDNPSSGNSRKEAGSWGEHINDEI